MHIGIIGGGSLGLLFAGKFAQAGIEVHMITRTMEQAMLLRQHGVLLHEDDDVVSVPLKAVHIHDDQTKQMLPRFDWLFIFVKQHHIDEGFIHDLTYWTEQEVPLLCFQNGIGHIERLAQSIPSSLIHTAITSEAALKLSPCEVKHTGKGQTLIGHEDQQYALSEAEANHLTKMLQLAGFTAFSSKNIKRIVWEKLLVNAVINPLTAILKVTNGELLSTAHWREVMSMLYDEGRAVAQSVGIDLAHHNWDHLAAVCQATSNNRSSMLQDVLAGRETEIEWINGALIRIAEQQQLPVPTHRAVYHLLKGFESSKK